MTTIQSGPGRLDEEVAFVTGRVHGLLAGLEGSRGLALLLDRGSRRCVVTSFWADEDARRAHADELAALREQATEALGGDVTVEDWESRLLHEVSRPAPGCCVRVTRLRMDPSDVDTGMDVLQTSVVPATEVLDGFCGISLWANARTGRAVSAVVYDSAESIAATRGSAARLRAASAAKSHATIEAVDEFAVLWTSWDRRLPPQGTQVPMQAEDARHSVGA